MTSTTTRGNDASAATRSRAEASRLTVAKEEILVRYRALLETERGSRLPDTLWQRLEDEITRTNNKIREIKLSCFAHQFFVGLPCGEKRGFPLRIPLRFFLQESPRGFPVGDR